jgi:uncharacterized membrane protein YphA (DoxX/SURF4 family)|tara:strand:+ start:257 stop:796 length:540 start_codon:yes stop_codon:yes gene_type:complete
MDQDPAPGVDQIGINLLRIVTGTFFMAVALELVDGFDPAVLFRPILSPEISGVAGATTLLALAIWFMLGAALRLAALSLALFVLVSSFTTNFIVGSVEDLSAFWYDLTLCCGVLLSYLTLDEQRLRRASVFSHHARVQRIAARRRVRPRRVAPDPDTKPAKRDRPAPSEEINIFADIRG